MDRAFKYFNLSGKILLADREYIGKDWFNYLVNKNLGFIIRLRKIPFSGFTGWVNTIDSFSNGGLRTFFET